LLWLDPEIDFELRKNEKRQHNEAVSFFSAKAFFCKDNARN
jgi:hypothetical protein